MTRRALIVANGCYQDQSFGALPGALADARQLAEVLGDPEVGAFAVEVLADADHRAVTTTIESFFADAGSGDLLLLHLSLHGHKETDGQLYFVVGDTQRARPISTAIPATLINVCMQRSRSRRIVVILDCCYSGAFSAAMRRRAVAEQVDVAEPFSGTGRVVITASTSLQYAYEGNDEMRSSRSGSQPSIFTGALVRGLRDGTADSDRDGWISVHELYTYVHEQVAERTPDQTPTLSVDNVQGTIRIARSGRHSDHDLVTQMQSAIAEGAAWMRIGALHLIERLLGSVRESTREAARNALLTLTVDADREVSSRATHMWQARALGALPATAPPAYTQRRLPVTGVKRVVGIDFGTTNSAIGLLEGGDVRLIPNREGSTITPSVAAITGHGTILVGEAAKRQTITNPAHTIHSIKLKLGTDWSIQRGEDRYSAADIATAILARLRQDAEDYLGAPPEGAVLTVPAYFDQVQRRSLTDAATAAGLPVLRIVNEPTAAAITYGLNQDKDSTVLMFDLGGGTFDVSIIEIGDGVCEVKATAGDNGLGGDNWDQALVEYLYDRALKQHGVTLAGSPEIAQRLKEAAEAAKIQLSFTTSAEVRLPYLAAGINGPLHLDITISRPKFEQLTSRLLERCRSPIELAMKDAGVTASDLHHIILVGGATRMPAVAQFVERLLGRPPYRGLIPEGVVTGATLNAGILTGQVNESLLLDVCPISLGIETMGGIFTKIIGRNTAIPTSRTEVFATADDEQDIATVAVFEGERELAAYNKKLLKIDLPITRTRRGEPSIEVTFNIDANGVLTVAAQQLDTAPKSTRKVARPEPHRVSNAKPAAQFRSSLLDATATSAAVHVDREGGMEPVRRDRCTIV